MSLSFLLLNLFLLALLLNVKALAAPILLSQSEKETLNANRVGIVTGGTGGTYIKLGGDLSRLLNDYESHTMRTVVMTGRGSVGNLSDLLYLKGVDLAIVQSDVLEHLRVTKPAEFNHLRKKVTYVTQLYNEEVHILAKGGIKELHQLAGKKVAIGNQGGGTSITAGRLFDAYFSANDRPKSVFMPAQESIDRLKSNTGSDTDISAMIYVAGKPAGVFKNLTIDDIESHNLNFVSIDLINELSDQYSIATLKREDYESLVLEQPVNTISVPAVLTAYAWSNAKNPKRYNNLKQFIDKFFQNIQRLESNGYHSKWCQIDLGKTIGGWSRYQGASEWLDSNPRLPRTINCESPQSNNCISYDDWMAENQDLNQLSSSRKLKLYQENKNACD